ncbi:MAG: polyprenol monophosphomannose synthase [Patescibacteria group bacterium]
MNIFNPNIFIVIPTYNEKENIENLINQIFGLNIYNLNILIVDDNSPDGTGKLIQELIPKYENFLHLIQRIKKSGLGSAYIAGFKYALEKNADLIFEMDADFSHDPKYIPDFIEEIKNGNDVVIGSRKIKGGKIKGWNLRRKFMSSGAMLFAKIILRLKTKDVTTGYRCYAKETLAQIDLDKIKSNGYAFQEEMIYQCEKKGFKIKEIPTTFIDRKLGKSKLGYKDIIEFFKTVFRLKFIK